MPPDFPLQPLTPAGARFVALAEGHAADFRTRAAEHDREASFAHENFAAMRESGFAGAFVPGELGGIGVTSLHDFAVAMSRLAHGDSGTAIAICMHFIITSVMARRWRMSAGAGEGLLREAAAGRAIIAATNSEAGSDPRHPFTEATRVDGGWSISGRKAFGTCSPHADYFSVNVMVRQPDGDVRNGIALLPRGLPGITVDPEWDAFGMRSSGSNDIIFEDVRVPEQAVTVGQKWGTFGAGGLIGGMTGGLGLAGPFLGIAEEARRLAIESAMTRRRRRQELMATLAPVQHLAAEMEIELAAARATLSRAAGLVDAFLAETGGDAPLEALQAHMKEVQAAKHYVNHAAIRIVDRALTLSGGAGFLNRSPLSRLYRDVRAGPFMSPLTAGDGMDYVGRVSLGVDPEIDA